jgi:hypothetical protein
MTGAAAGAGAGAGAITGAIGAIGAITDAGARSRFASTNKASS